MYKYMTKIARLENILEDLLEIYVLEDERSERTLFPIEMNAQRK